MSTTAEDAALLANLKRLRSDYPLYATKCLKIRDKDGLIIPFVMNSQQRYLHEKLEEQRRRTGKVRAIIGKGRQTTASTYVGGRFYHRTSLHKGLRTFILTHSQAGTDALFEMVTRFHEHTPLRPSTGASNEKELYFDKLDSGYSVGVASNKGTGRSQTIQMLHWSEVAHSANADAHQAGVIQTVPDRPGTEIIKESTGNGPTGLFHADWQQAEAGIGDYIAVFIPWHVAGEYSREPEPGFALDEEEREYRRLYSLTDGQMCWRRAKILELKDPRLFKQEYPACVAAGQRVGVAEAGLVPIEQVQVGCSTQTGSVSAVMANGERETVKVRTEMGYEVICTPDHRIARHDGAWIEAGETEGEIIQLAVSRFAVNHHVVEWWPFPCVVSRLAVTERFARLLGYFMGDGSWYDGTFSIVCTGVDDDVVADVLALVAEFIGEPTTRPVGKRCGGTEVRVCRSGFADVLRALDVIRPSSPHRIVKVPEAIFASPKPIVREFLRALFEADGFCQRNGAGVSLFSKHEAFLRDVQHLLLGFGITCRRTRERKITKDGRVFPGNALVLRAKETRLFLRHIGFISKRKQDRLSGYRSNGQGRPGQDASLLDRVVSVTDAGTRQVFDLTIPGAECFDSGGILVHNCSMEMFQYTAQNSFIDPELVMAARRNEREGIGALVIGVDPGGRGLNGRFSVAWRRGRKVLKVESRSGIGTTEQLAWLRDIIDQDKPDAVFMDVGGGGDKLYDLLVAWGEPYGKVLKLVNFGDPAHQEVTIERDGTKRAGPYNRRAQMWERLFDWLGQPGGSDLPDRDSLQSDLAAPGSHYRTQDGKLLLESKEEMKKRGIRSPDEGDATALTFAEPVVQKRPVTPKPEQPLQLPTGPSSAWMAT